MDETTYAPALLLVAPSPPSFFADDASRWAAVQARDAVADGFFVCKARLARRANVRFYHTGEEASRAGYRACKRCKPDLAGFMPEERAVRQIRAFVREHHHGDADAAVVAGSCSTAASGRMSLAEMAGRTGLSKWHFHRVFKKCVGVTPFEYLRTQRLAWGDDQSLSQQLAWPSLDEDQPQQHGFLGPEFDFAAFDLATESSSEEGLSMASGSLTTTTASGSGCSPLSLDDLLVWPEDNP